jgi:uncharacterized protein
MTRKILSRRSFAATALASIAAAQDSGDQALANRARQKKPQNANATPQNTSNPKKNELAPEVPPFGESLTFARKTIQPRVQQFQMTQVRLLPGECKSAQDANLGYLKRLDADRLLHNFRVNAGLPSSAEPLGGWEKPDCELRGHFVGHFLSACALMYSATGDESLKAKGDGIVAGLAECQAKLGGGYLSAFPLSFFDRLNARTKVWAPFYTIHKIMAGMYDMHEHCGNAQALKVLCGMADWADHWTAAQPEPHMQDILNTEYGGMNEVLYNLAALTGEERYAIAGDRFTKKKFFNPLALSRDELRGLHVNTHIPQVIGAARRYEISGDERFHDVADFFWYEVTSARAYVTGGTSNNELWLVEPHRLGTELKLGTDTTECCCAYNMLKLTSHLYEWTADPRYFDYYERTLWNHRLGTLDENGHGQYYLSIVPSAWRTFGKENDSFWCCTGTGIEEFAKLNSAIYFHDAQTLYVNLFIPSEVTWEEKNVTFRQETSFPKEAKTVLIVQASEPLHMPIKLRIPAWSGASAAVTINGDALDVVPSPGSYFTVARTWNNGDRIELSVPMSLRIEKMQDEPFTQALLYGPLVLAGELESDRLPEELVYGPGGPAVRKHPEAVPEFKALGDTPEAWVKPKADKELVFRTTGQKKDVTLQPLYRVREGRYSIYWNVT